MGGWSPGICLFHKLPRSGWYVPGFGAKLLCYMITSTWLKSSRRAGADTASSWAQATRRVGIIPGSLTKRVGCTRGHLSTDLFFLVLIWMSFCSFQKYQLLNTYYVLNSVHNRNASFFTTTKRQPLLQIPFSGWGNWGKERQLISPKSQDYYVADPGLKLRPAARQLMPPITVLYKSDKKKKKE